VARTARARISVPGETGLQSALFFEGNAVFDLIVDFVSRSGYIGVFLLMAAENIFPPIPSEMIMPLAGFAAARGDMHIAIVILVGTLGSIAGALPWYYAGRLFGQDRIRRLAARHGRLMTVTPEDFDKALHTFERHGRAAVFFGRLIPAIRTLISVPAGIARMSMPVFLAYSVVGSAIWTGLLAAAGYILQSQYTLIEGYVDPVSKGVVALVVIIYLYRVITFRPSASASGKVFSDERKQG
jgi:membrane protein DedA with SNARE-associated domain